MGSGGRIPALFLCRLGSSALLVLSCLGTFGAFAKEDQATAREEIIIAARSNVQTVVSGDKSVSYHLRLQAAHSLGKHLKQADLQELYSFLERNTDRDPLPGPELNALKNSVANVIMSQSPTPDDFGQRLLRMYHDQAMDPVWRDYCIQFLSIWYSQARSVDERSQIEAAFWDAAERNWSTAGTALLAMHRLSGSPHDGAIAPTELCEAAMKVASDPDENTAARMAAIQVCAMQKHEPVLRVARVIAYGKDAVPLRMSAIAAVGLLGDKNDAMVLGDYTHSADVRIRHAALAAVERINARAE